MSLGEKLGGWVPVQLAGLLVPSKLVAPPEVAGGYPVFIARCTVDTPIPRAFAVSL